MYVHIHVHSIKCLKKSAGDYWYGVAQTEKNYCFFMENNSIVELGVFQNFVRLLVALKVVL